MKEIVYKDLKIGDELVSRSGLQAFVLAKLDTPCAFKLVVKFICIDRETCETYTVDGKSNFPGIESPMDLFIPAKKEYINLHRFDNGRYSVYGPYDCRVDASISNGEDPTFIKTIEVEV